MGTSPRPRASTVTGPGVTFAPGSGWGSKIHGFLAATTGVAVWTGAGVAEAAGDGSGVAEAGTVLGVATTATATTVGEDVRAATATGEDVTAATGTSVTSGGLFAVLRAELAAPTADANAPTADHARLPNSKMPTMPTMVAISRAGEPSSDGGAGRATGTP
jgi:hypothetical protein